MFTQPSHYFLNISFDWSEILGLLGVLSDEIQEFQITDKFHSYTPNANSSEYEFGMNSEMAMFEYYVMPDVLRNGPYNDSAIFDCQYKKFFSTINTRYSRVLECKDSPDIYVSCWLERNSGKNKSAFSIGILQEFVTDAVFLTFVFPEEYLNKKDAHKTWGAMEEVRVFKTAVVHMEENKVTEISTPPKSLLINIMMQSEHDAQVGPGFHREIIDLL